MVYIYIILYMYIHTYSTYLHSVHWIFVLLVEMICGALAIASSPCLLYKLVTRKHLRSSQIWIVASSCHVAFDALFWCNCTVFEICFSWSTYVLFDILPGHRKCVTLKESGSLAAIVWFEDCLLFPQDTQGTRYSNWMMATFDKKGLVSWKSP